MPMLNKANWDATRLTIPTLAVVGANELLAIRR
jgi:hypothetical protein